MNRGQNDAMSASARLASLNRRFADRGDPVSIGEIVDGLGSAGVGMTLLLMSLPALIPIPGPFGLVFGSVVALLAVQLMFGARRLYLPEIVRARRLPADTVGALAIRCVPLLQWIERYLRPRRWLPLTGLVGRMAIAIPIIVMGIAVALPVPTGNIPPVASLIALSLGLMTRDGLAIVVGLVLAVVAAGWFAFLYLFGTAIWTQLSRLFLGT